MKKLLLTLSLLIVTATPSFATWSVAERGYGAQNSFVISKDEVVETPENNQTYAYIEYGVITKIIYWQNNSTNSYITSYVPASSLNLSLVEDITFMAKVPDSFKVNYNSSEGTVKSDVINHSDKVQVVESLEPNALQSLDIPFENQTQVLSTSINSDYSTSITVAPIVNNDPTKTVEVQVISNGLSFTSIATDNTNTPITINNLPSNEYITVQTVVKDSNGVAEPYQNTPVITANANVPELFNVRDVQEDKENISAPQAQTVVNSESRSMTASISYAAINNFDSSKTMASIMVVGPNGSTTYIGVDGSGGTVNVGDLSSMSNYTVKMVIRDINTGEETIISGNNIGS